MNINILKEKNELLLEEVARWVGKSKSQCLEVNVLCEPFLKSCCDIYVAYKEACRSGSRVSFSDGLQQVVTATRRLDFWVRCLEAYDPGTATDLYAIKKEAADIKALCIASIKTMVKKEKPH